MIFGLSEAPFSHLGASWGILGASWGVLGASWGVLERLGRVLKRKKRERGPEAVQSRSSAWPLGTNNNQDEERLTVERLPTERLQKTFVETECL